MNWMSSGWIPFLDSFMLSEGDRRAPLIKQGLRHSHIDTPTGSSLYVRPFEGNGWQFLENQRFQNAVLLVCDIYVNDPDSPHQRRFGPNITELVHLLWVAYLTYNSLLVRQTLDTAGVDPVVAAIAAVIHDTPETQRDIDLKQSRIYDEDALYEKMRRQIPLTALEGLIVREVDFVHLTDSDIKLSSKARIDAQKEKPTRPAFIDLDAAPDTIKQILDVIEILNITIRAGDKRNNLGLDRWWRECFKIDHEAGLVPDNASLTEKRLFGLPDEDLAPAIERSEWRKYAVDRAGVPRYLAEDYEDDLAFLRAELRRVQVKPSLADLAEITAHVAPVQPKGDGMVPRPATAATPS